MIFLKKNIFIFISIAFFSILFSCKKNESSNTKTLFTTLPSSQTGVTFRNDLEYNEKFNIYTYRNFYNGGGVAIGDINNDGLPDIYMSSNMHHNKLYLNKGNFQFEDITEKAGVAGTKAWATGVTMVDVNGDGLLDIYVCNSGDIKGDDKENELFINAGNLTFKEQAKEYGLADKGYSTHAAFFDYDHDGDLDCYLLNNSFQAIGSFNLKNNLRNVRDTLGGHKLLRNDNNHFVDVSEKAGIYGSVQAFGLGVTVGDVNKDGWLDIYVSNDFFERDYLYINQKNGTFKEDFERQFTHCSAASMGTDMADINNDAYPDFFATDMLPDINRRFKTKTTFDNWNNYYFNYVQNGYFHQFTRNMLQLNNADGTFTEIGRMAGIEATDWSWGALITDLDNDGWKDIYVANGIYKDLTDQDFIQFIGDEETKRAVISRDTVTQKVKVDFKKLIDVIPSEPLSNYAFSNNRNLTFTDKAKEWGLAQPSFSNGAAYADLDNDGDLDLVVNNVNSEAFVYRNEANTQLPDNHWLTLQLVGEGANPFAVGAKVTAYGGGQTFYVEQIPTRGFESSVDCRPRLGLGGLKTLDSVLVEFPTGKNVLLTNVKTNQFLTVKSADGTLAKEKVAATAKIPYLFEDVTKQLKINYKHEENRFSDFDNERLIYNMLSTQGPKMCVGDVNNDGKDDFYVGGAAQQAGKLFVQQANGTFKVTNESIFQKDAEMEDTDAAFFDADGDHDLDLYVASGGSESNLLEDRLYLNDGKGNFKKSEDALPSGKPTMTSCVRPYDFDGDGDLDLFVGMRGVGGVYGAQAASFLLENDGKAHFRPVNTAIAPELSKLGMITDARWADVDGDGDADLIVIGDWMTVTIFENKDKKFTPKIIQNSSGWWNCLKVADFDGDGDLDFVCGNHGLNSRFHASEKEPITMYFGDFDKNGTPEQVVSQYIKGVDLPLALRHDLVQQMPSLKKKYLKYINYADQKVSDIFTKEQLKNARISKVNQLESCVFLNDGKGNFTIKPLPTMSQLSPIFGLNIDDFDGDGKLDILEGGNFLQSKPEVGSYDADTGVWLRGDGKGNFTAVASKDSGFRLYGAVRDIQTVKVGGKNLIFVVKNNDVLQIFKRKT